MTATTEAFIDVPVILVPDEVLSGITDEARRAEMYAEMLRRQELFDATRLPCPPWCDGTCETVGHNGDATMHRQSAASVAVSVDGCDPQGRALVAAWRYEHLDEGVSHHVDLDIIANGEQVGLYATMSPAQARQLAAELVRSADLADQEPAGGAE